MNARFYCTECLATLEAPDGVDSGEVACPDGHPPFAFQKTGDGLASCWRCAATAFFAQKDFDQRLGCLILGAGAAIALVVAYLAGGMWFVPVLLAIAAIDFVLVRRVGTVVICYRCDSEYRGLPDVERFKPYDPHIAERYAELKTVRRMNP